MPDWLGASFSTQPGSTPAILAWRIAAAAVLGMAVTLVYRWARRGEAVQTTFLATLVLLAAVIAMATQVIGDNVARAFSLVGALSVVRFRAAVRDTQDIAFVMLAVVVGMASGSDHLAVALVGLGVVGVSAFPLWPRRAGGWRDADGTLSFRVVRAGGVQGAAEQVIARSSSRMTLTSASIARKGAALDLAYRIRLRPDRPPAALVSDLGALDGVEDVELRRCD